MHLADSPSPVVTDAFVYSKTNQTGVIEKPVKELNFQEQRGSCCNGMYADKL